MAEKEVKILPLTGERMGEIPGRCPYCLYWEDPQNFDPTCGDPKAMERKKEILTRLIEEIDSCGVLAYEEGQAVGFAQFCPPSFAPQIWSYAAGPVDPDALFLCCLYIPDPDFRRRGTGKAMLKEVITMARKKGWKAIETFARKKSANNPSGPLGFYLKNGFHIVRDDGSFPLLRLDLS